MFGRHSGDRKNNVSDGQCHGFILGHAPAASVDHFDIIAVQQPNSLVAAELALSEINFVCFALLRDDFLLLDGSVLAVGIALPVWVVAGLRFCGAVSCLASHSVR